MAMLSNGPAPQSSKPTASGATGPLSFMDADITNNPRLMEQFEGLVRTTASELDQMVEEEYDEICQFLRYKVWKALEAFSPDRVKTTSRYSPDEQRRRFVFSCIVNAKKDVLKKKRRNTLFIEDVAPVEENGSGRKQHSLTRSGFEQRYMSLEDAFRAIEEDVPQVPCTLTRVEREVLLLLILDYKPAEIAVHISGTRKDVHAITKSIRDQMRDWHPNNGGPPAEALLPMR